VAHNEDYTGMIVNGRNAESCTWPWQISMVDGDFAFCGGTLINPWWVLTAAHCFDQGGIEDKWVVAGMHDKRIQEGGDVQKRRIVEKVLHPKYEEADEGYDLALVRVAVDDHFVFNECVNPACLPDAGAGVSGTCWITGWGTTSSGGSSPNIHQEASVEIKTNSECNTAYGGKITDDMLCANGKNSDNETTDACQGDSGGPLVCEDSAGQWTVHGATSWGRGCAAEQFPGVWARVAHPELRDWVASMIAYQFEPTPPPPSPAPAPPGSWTITSGTGCEVTTDDPPCIHSKGYPLAYGDNETCVVDLVDVQLRVDGDFRTESGYDKLKISDGGGDVKEFHGINAGHSDSTDLDFFGDGRVITGSLTWTSDGSVVTAPGWKLCRSDR